LQGSSGKSSRQRKTIPHRRAGPDEFEQMRLGIGEMLIPLGALRKR